MNNPSITQFLTAKKFAVVGASSNRNKFGNMILRCYIENNLTVYPVHHMETTIEGLSCYKTINELPSDVESISIITPPSITEQVVIDAVNKGIKNIWMQPGSQSQTAIDYCLKHNINLISDGSCLLITLNFTH